MAALTADRNTVRRDGVEFGDPVAASTVIYAGSMVALNASGDAVPASAAATQRTRGVAEEHVDNAAGAAGAKKVIVRRGLFRFANSASTDLIARADIGNPCYVVDDQTVAKTSNSNARPVAGTIRDVEAAGVWVEF